MAASLPTLLHRPFDDSLTASRTCSNRAGSDNAMKPILENSHREGVQSGGKPTDVSRSAKPLISDLEWTCAPQNVACEDEGSGMMCRVGLPVHLGQRGHKTQLKRSSRTEQKTSRPNLAATKSQPLPLALAASRYEHPAEYIHVTESDFRRCGNDLKLLRECQARPKTQPQPVRRKMQQPQPVLQVQHVDGCVSAPPGFSFGTAFALRCREKSEPCDPWRGKVRFTSSSIDSFGLNPEGSIDSILADSQIVVESLQPWKLDDPTAPAPSSTSTRASAAGSCPSKNDPLRKQLSTTRAYYDTQRQRACSESRGKGGDGCQSNDTVASPLTSKFESPIQPLGESLEAELGRDVSERSYGSLSDQRCIRHLGRYTIAGVDPESFVIWYFLDPHSGEVCCYPPAAAKRLEEGYCNGRSSVPLAGLGGRIDSAIVYLEGDVDGGMSSARSGGVSKSCRNADKTMTTNGFVEKAWSGGCRDVARVNANSSWHDLCVRIIWDASACQWRLAGDAEECVAGAASVVMRRVRLTGEEMVPPPTSPLPSIRDRRLCFISPAFLIDPRGS